MRKNCSSDPEFFLKFEAEGREFAKFLRSLEQFIQTVKGQNNFLVTECFFNLFLKASRKNALKATLLKGNKKRTKNLYLINRKQRL